MKLFAVDLWSTVFWVLHWMSPLRIIRACIPPPRESNFFIDLWSLMHLFLAILLLVACSAPGLHWWEITAIVYGGLRVLEIVIFQVNVLLFDEYRAKKADRSYFLVGFRRIVILLLQNYIEIILWFAVAYRNLHGAFQGAPLDSFFESLNLSFVAMTTFGQSDIKPQEILGKVLILLQAGIGLFMSLAVLARFISLLPEPKTLDNLET